MNNQFRGNFQSRQNLSRSYDGYSQDSGIKLSWFFGIMGLIVIIGLASLFLFFNGSSGGETPKNLPATINEGTTAAAVVDCGADIDCLIEEAESCNSAKMTAGEPTFEFLGMLITVSGTNEIKGIENGKCILSSKTESYEVGISEELRNELLASGVTEGEIESTVEEANSKSDSIIGSVNFCRFEKNSDLVFYLQSIKDGDFTFRASGSLTTEEPEIESTLNGMVLDCEYIPAV